MNTSRTVLLVSGCALLTLSACGQPNTETNNVVASETSAVPSNAVSQNESDAGNLTTSGQEKLPPWAIEPDAVSPPLPTKNYASREGNRYYYISAVSDDEKKTGKAVGDVLIYRYLGVIAGKYTIQQELEDGTAVRIATCQKPCAIIKMTDQNGQPLDLIPYSESSVIGSAFADSFNGFLKRSSHRVSTGADAAQNSSQP